MPELKNNAYALLNTGVMYANGLYFKKDIKQAINYFYKALDEGELFYSVKYLICALPGNIKEDEEQELIRIIKIGCNNNNKYCEKLLQDIYTYLCIENNDEFYLTNFNKKSNKEQLNILNEIYMTVGEASYTEATKWNYIIHEDGNVSARVTETEADDVPIKIKRFGLFSTDYEMIFEKNN